MASYKCDVSDLSQVGEARRNIAVFSTALGFDETILGKISIVVTELANNLVKHARNGEIIYRALSSGDNFGIELLSVDRGPGMADIAECMRDGYSTAGTPGTGLGAIIRQSSAFDIYSVQNLGTVLLSQIWAKPLKRASQVGAICLPKAGETECGDSWDIIARPGSLTLVVADGLGHGPVAAKASAEAVQIFHDNQSQKPCHVLQSIHSGLRGTRGAAVSVAQIDYELNKVTYAGIGNIAGSIVTDSVKTQNMVSHNGTAGHVARTLSEFVYSWTDASSLIMYSDGLTNRWSLERYPGLAMKHPSVVAAVLYRDFCRGTDDVTVLVARREQVA